MKNRFAICFACSLVFAFHPVRCLSAEDAASESGFTSIFNGKDLAGWDGHPKLWSVKDGAITGQTTPENPARKNTFLIWTNGVVDDFELRCSFKLVPNNDAGFANSGIQYRSKVVDPSYWVVGGYQADMEAGPVYTGILYEEAMTRGIMAGCGEKVVWGSDCKKEVTGSVGKAAELQAAVKRGDWNDYIVIAQGNHLRQFVNGKQTVDVTDDCESKRAMSGVVALQLHAGQPFTVQFKDIRLKKFKGGDLGGDDIKNMQGVWHAASGEQEGSAVDPQDITNIVVTVQGTNYTVVSDTMNDRGTFTVDPSRSPKHMDIFPHTGEGEGRTLPAIYEVASDALKVCYAREGSKRPASFSTSDDSRLLLIVYKRAPH